MKANQHCKDMAITPGIHRLGWIFQSYILPHLSRDRHLLCLRASVLSVIFTPQHVALVAMAAAVSFTLSGTPPRSFTVPSRHSWAPLSPSAQTRPPLPPQSPPPPSWGRHAPDLWCLMTASVALSSPHMFLTEEALGHFNPHAFPISFHILLL